MKTKSFSTASGAVLALGTAILAVSPDAAAQVVLTGSQVLGYNVAGFGDASTTLTSRTIASGLTASDLNAVGALSPWGYAGTFMLSGWGTSADLGKYYQFTVSPTAGNNFTPTAVSFGWASELAASGWSLSYSIDNFANTLGTASGSLAADSQGSFSVPISGVTVNSGSTLSFKIFGLSEDGQWGSGLAYDASLPGTGANLVVSGLVVPEPEQYAMLAGLGLLAFAAYRRYNFNLQKA